MTAREYAAACGVELVGKLTRKIYKHTEFNWKLGVEEEKSSVYYVDEAGTEIAGSAKTGWCIITPDGGVI